MKVKPPTVIEMKYTSILMALVLSLYSASYAQPKNQFPKSTTMDLSKITNQTVKQAIEALQSGDKAWYGFFSDKVVMTDDGNKMDFKSFFAKALGKEQFLTIDKVENDGKDIYGNFQAGQWGMFKVFFKFHQNAEGKFDRLDIGQATY